MTVLFEEVKKVTVVPLFWLEPWEAVGNPLLSVVRMNPAGQWWLRQGVRVEWPNISTQDDEKPWAQCLCHKTHTGCHYRIEVKGGFNSASR